MQPKVDRRDGAAQDVILSLVPGGERRLAHLSDGELLENTRCLVGESNRVLAHLLLHLAEVEARGVHRTRACSSLYHYCIYELRFSEDAAARRVSAAKLVKRFPALLEAVERGELHLTGVLMIGPHLTLENQVEVLGRAKFRSKKELARLVRELAPLPSVADVIEPLGPEPASRSPATWERFVTSLAPRVRDLPDGERPSDWLPKDDTGSASRLRSTASPAPRAESHARDESECSPLTALADPSKIAEDDGNHATRSPAKSASGAGRADAPPSSMSLPMPAAPLRYGMQFTTTEEHVRLVERAKALLAREAPLSLSELHVAAMKLFVAALEKRKFGARSRRKEKALRGRAESSAAPQKAELVGGGRGRAEFERPADGKERTVTQAERNGAECGESADCADGFSTRPDHPGKRPAGARVRVIEPASSANGRKMSKASASVNETHEGAAYPTNSLAGEQDLVLPAVTKGIEARLSPARHGALLEDWSRTPSRQRGRSIPATVRRAVFERDEGRCTFQDGRGERCRETRYLELHHRVAHARGGPPTVTNLTLHCSTHNALVAELDFGRDFVTERRNRATHEACSSQER